ncbi:MAG: HAD hydrolase-like protein [Candidatus Hydrogenedentes bacterium]|nr:HAD hydrolase-like protein [Candidatus Hydrogenedentota bacterium]
MKLVLFDIDGTLTATSRTDNACYARAFERAFGKQLPTTDWRAYVNVTDVGILHEVLDNGAQTPLNGDDVTRFEGYYREELQTAFLRDPSGFRAVPGARTVLRTIEEREDTAAALATGGMRRTALFKLARIGVDGTAIPGAFANDALTRAEIARKAIERSGVDADDIIYIGDGVWDVQTAADLDIRFIGMVHESNAESLRAAGARTFLSDYRDPIAFEEALETATVPETGRG